MYLGSAKALINTYKFDNFFGEDGFGDFNFTQQIIAKVHKNKRAPELFIDLAKKYPGNHSFQRLFSSITLTQYTKS